MKLLLAAPFLLLLGLYLWLRFWVERKTATKIDGYTIKIHQGREDAWIVYSEPSGRNVTFDVYWERRNTPPKLRVEFPSTFSLTDAGSPVRPSQLTQVEIPDAHSAPTQLSPIEVGQVKERISQALTKRSIEHEFVRPQRSGWTSFENGKEIYHGGPGTIGVNDQPK